MKRNRYATVLLFVLIAAFVTACGTSTATITYRTIAGVKLAVDTSMNVWADRVLNHQTTPQQEAQVRAAFEKYTATAAAAAAIMRASDTAAPPDMTQAADALLNLLAAFGVSATPATPVTTTR